MDMFVHRDLISSLAMFLFVMSKEINLLMRSPEFLMHAGLIVSPGGPVNNFGTAFDIL